MLAQARGVRIPMAGGFDSLNVAVTSGIVLHQLTQGSALAIRREDPSLAS
jgi:tRNA G18 (ribose-2'-O)-methylase SpoU